MHLINIPIVKPDGAIWKN